MSAINLIRARLSNNTAIAALFTAQYAKQPKHFGGYRATQNGNDYPVICYVPVKATFPRINRQVETQTLSLIVGLNDSRFIDSEGAVLDKADIASAMSLGYSGVVVADEIMQAIIADFCSNLGVGEGWVISSEFKINTDLSLKFPFFESELSFELSKQVIRT